MAEAKKGPKKIGIEDRPATVRLSDNGEIYFVTCFKTGVLEIRPKGARDPDAKVLVPIGQVYRNALVRRVKKTKAPRRRLTDRRGLLALEREAERKLT